jgi:hypothetical protein
MRPLLLRIAVGLRRHATETDSESTEDLEAFRDQASFVLASLRALVGRDISKDLLATPPSTWVDTESVLYCFRSIAAKLDVEEVTAVSSRVLAPLLAQNPSQLPSSICKSLVSLVSAVAPVIATQVPELHEPVLVQGALLAAQTLGNPALATRATEALAAMAEDLETATILASAVQRGSALCSAAFSNSTNLPTPQRAEVTKAICRIARAIGETGISVVLGVATQIAAVVAASHNPFEASSGIWVLAEIAASLDFGATSERSVAVSQSSILALHQIAWPAASRAMIALGPLRPRQADTYRQEDGDVVSAACHLLKIEFLAAGRQGTALLGSFGELLQSFQQHPRSCILMTVAIAAGALPCLSEPSASIASFLDCAVPLVFATSRAAPSRRLGLLRSLFGMALQVVRHQHATFFQGCACSKQLFADATSLVDELCGCEKWAMAECLRFLIMFVEVPKAEKTHDQVARFVGEEGAGRALCTTLVRSLARPATDESLHLVASAFRALIERHPEASRAWLAESLPSRDFAEYILQAATLPGQMLTAVENLARHLR